MTKPPHHGPHGRFRAPWPEAAEDASVRARLLEVVRAWITSDLPKDPEPGDLPTARPAIARPRAPEGECRVTWVGHATFLIQLPGLNVLTDPVWSKRVSPLPMVLGSPRFVPAVPELEALPPIDAVLLSHDHYDHLDRPTVRRLARRGDDPVWFTPLGYRDWFRRLGVERVVEFDWWDEATIPGTDWSVTAAPARHWSRRTPWDTNRRLWCSWAIRSASSGRDGPAVFAAGDTAYGSFFREIGERLGPFDVSLIPIGAYEPRWFMRVSHANPEEAVRIWQDLGARGAFVPMHWGTFRLTFEPPLEPPDRLRAAWADAGLAEELLRIPRHGETLVVDL